MKKVKISAVILSSLIFVWLVFSGFTPPKATYDLYVADYANVMTAEDTEHIIGLSKSLQKACGAQIAVLTTNDIQGLDIEEYARKTGNAWGLGDKEKDNGVIIALYLGDDSRDIWVSVGTGLEGRLNDGKVGRFIDNYALDDLKAGNYSVGITKLYDEILNSVMLEYGIEKLDNVETHEEEDEDDLIYLLIPFIIFMIIAIISVFGSMHGGRRGGVWIGGFPGGFGGGSSGGGFSGGGSFGGGGGFSGGGAGRSF